MIWAAMSSAGVGPLCFLKSTVNADIYQEILEHFMLPSADKLYGDADFIFQQDLAPAHTAKGTKSWFNDHGITVLDRPSNSPDLNPIESRWETPDPTMQMTWRPLSKQPGLHDTWAVTQTDCLHATPHWRQPFGASHIVQNQCFYFSLIVFLIVWIFRGFYGTKLHLCIYLCINYIYCLLTTISLHEISNLNCW